MTRSRNDQYCLSLSLTCPPKFPPSFSRQTRQLLSQHFRVRSSLSPAPEFKTPLFFSFCPHRGTGGRIGERVERRSAIMQKVFSSYSSPPPNHDSPRKSRNGGGKDELQNSTPLLSSFPCFNICLYVPQEQKVLHFHSLDPPGARALRRFFSLEKVIWFLGYKSNKITKIFFLQKFRCLSCLISLSKWFPSLLRVPGMHNSIIDRDFLHLS